ncbi:MAG: gliding motility-associated protein GldE [Bacteroidetes bacterium]|nr:gliding motility-associated protein GldE [Bacteroidota bacterium]MBK8145619.1 gliding motility-associated protein GldE [Bacteroidota bacterium]MBP6316337.1 gliding motility-associated protein GldE [Chitinophagaceae bacterium]
MDPDSTYSTLLNTLLSAQLSTNSQITLVIVIILLIILTALISGSEVALFSLSAKDINYIKTKQDYANTTLLNLLENPKRLLATILIGNNFLSIGVIISTNSLYKSIFHFETWLPAQFSNFAGLIDIIFQVIIVTFFLVLFGEVLPKVYATQNNMRLSLFVAPYIKFLDKAFSPLSNFLVNSTTFIEDKFSRKSKNDISNEEIEHAIELTVKHSATQEEVNIFKGILKFGDITAKQIMQTRLDVSGIDFAWDFAKVKDQVLDTGFSRLPVYSESLDEIKGIIHTKDLLLHIDTENFDWHSVIRSAYFVHESKLIEDLLKEFQHKRSHMAIVVDEFGGTSGIVTLEDIMEEIIGDIKDEYDEEGLFSKKIDEHNFIFEGKTLINDMCKITGIPVEVFEEARGESDSIAGLVLEIAGKFPQQNEIVSFMNYDFTVIQLEKMRIQRIKLTISPVSENI